MSEVINVTINKPISLVSSGENGIGSAAVDNSAVLKRQVDAQLEKLESLCSALSSAIEQTNRIKQDALEESKQEIARLAVEIAELVIADKISSDDYDIEKIIADTIKDIPDKSDVSVEVNDQDKKVCEEIMCKNPESPLRLLKLKADSSIGKAQCRVRTENGRIDHFYQEQLEKIAKALTGSQD